MTKNLNKPKASDRGPEMDAGERFRSLLVPVDLTAISDRVLGRVALLPLADGTRVTLLHVVPKNLPVSVVSPRSQDTRAHRIRVVGTREVRVMRRAQRAA